MILVALAGIGAGAINALVGSGTLITFPTLVALGYPPVTATMSNAVGLVAGSASGTWGYRRELRGQWRWLRWQLIASLTGSMLGAWLLLHLPSRLARAVLIGGMLVIDALQVVERLHTNLPDGHNWWVSLAVLALILLTVAIQKVESRPMRRQVPLMPGSRQV